MPDPRALVAILLVAVAVALHGRPAPVRDQVPAGRDHRDARPRPACTSRSRCCRTCSSTTSAILMLENRRADRVTTSEKKPLLVDFFVLWRIIDVQAVLRQRCRATRRPRARRLSQTVRAQPRRGVQQAHGARGDLDRARQDHDRRRGRRPTRDAQVDRRRDRRRAAAPRRAADRCHRPGLRSAWNRSAGASPTSCARTARRNRKRSAPMPTASAQVILADAYKAGAEDQGRRRRQGVRDLRRGVRPEPGVLRVLPQPRSVQGDVPQQERPDGARPERRLLPVPQAIRAAARAAARAGK